MAELKETSTILSCYHCGEVCKDDSIFVEEKYFCCNGCKTVYEILNQNNLCNYYRFQSSPGISPALPSLKKFDYLDEPDVISSLTDYHDDNITTVTFNIPQMHCSSCIWLLENLHKLNPAVYTSQVDFLKKKINIRFRHNDLSLKELVILLTSIGYEPSINLDSTEKKPEGRAYKHLYYKIGIAAFSFGNIMLFTFPEYLSLNFSGTFFSRIFGYLNLLLAIPVFCYSASGYFISAVKGLSKKVINIDVPIALGIVVLFIRSSYEVLSQTGSGYFDSLTGLVFFLLIGKIFQEKTYDALNFERSYKAYFPLAVTVKSGSEEKSVPVSKLKIGDRILIHKNEIIPADSILFNGEGLIDYSFVTGESVPVRKVSGELIFAGGRQTSGIIELEVVKEVSQSYLTQLWNNDTFLKKTESRFKTLSDTVSKYFTSVILLIAAISFLFWLPESIGKAINVFTAVLIVACPCALALSVPFTLGNSLRIFGRSGFYLKNSDIVEQLSKVNAVVLDKTGTITETDSANVIYRGKPLNNFQQEMIKSLARNSTHPFSRKIYEALPAERHFEVSEFQEYTGLGIEGRVYTNVIKIGSAEFINVNDEDFPETRVYISINNEFYGFFRIENLYRDGIGDLIDNLKKSYPVYLLSGDNESEKENLKKLFGDESKLLFNQSPSDKLNFVKRLQKNNHSVLMIGDGLNDAGALRQSDAGIAVTDDVHSFSPACDGIIDSARLKYLPRFIKFSVSSVRVIITSFIISFIYNVIGLGFAVEGVLSPIVAAILMPLSSVSVVVFATGATNLLAKRRGLLSQL
ncbi:MAG: heavy metal translocating P-type ATPase metal-binding domain-containing protein [Ignavibacteriaceae bacterium]